MVETGLRVCVFSGSHAELLFFFFFQAEDGIRDLTVTGVQTCALPISVPATRRKGSGHAITIHNPREHNLKGMPVRIPLGTFTSVTGVSGSGKSTLVKIGRASCRERV